ncbi:hypothetical protein [Rhizobium lusitanum]|uniref:hypothetical protein n=1 Tax=Rhizobium lusitanum TaxID=293958 RepID=UPI0013DD3995|nr:hypothetical protein [Rhizobium lusitanum]
MTISMMIMRFIMTGNSTLREQVVGNSDATGSGWDHGTLVVLTRPQTQRRLQPKPARKSIGIGIVSASAFVLEAGME